MLTMSGMHAQDKQRTRTPGLGAAWAVLLGGLGTSVTYNVVHATAGARLEVALALLLGFMPAFIAACLSHSAAVLDAPWQAKAIVTAIMGGGMVLSASAVAAVAAPAEPGWRGWLFGGVLDAGALWALWAIMYSRRRKAAITAEVEAARAEAAQARAGAAEMAQAAREQAASAEGERSRLAEELALARAEFAQRLEAVSEELEAAKTAHTALLERVAASARKPRKAPRKNAQAEDLTTELRALAEFEKDPSLREPRQGGELARRLGVSPATGRRVHAKLTAQDRPVEPHGERSEQAPE